MVKTSIPYEIKYQVTYHGGGKHIKCRTLWFSAPITRSNQNSLDVMTRLEREIERLENTHCVVTIIDMKEVEYQ